MYSVKQLSRLAGVSVRTLHYYDEIGLFKAVTVKNNGYRFYSDENLLQLQQILFYREMGLELAQIKNILQKPGFDPAAALRTHRSTLLARIERLNVLVRTVDATLAYMNGEKRMDQNQLFAGFTPEEEEKYNQEAVNRWGDTARGSVKRWKDYRPDQKEEILRQGKEIYTEIAAKMHLGPSHPEVQAALTRWHQHLRNFYEPTPEILRGLGELYAADPAFHANIAKLDPALPDFMKEAIQIYVDGLTN
jgi:DNA-binding transcriptional MerR regulator